MKSTLGMMITAHSPGARRMGRISRISTFVATALLMAIPPDILGTVPANPLDLVADDSVDILPGSIPSTDELAPNRQKQRWFPTLCHPPTSNPNTHSVQQGVLPQDVSTS